MSRKLLNTGIYCFENKINGKRYIGQAHNIERRIYEHEFYLKRGVDKCIALQRAINKYGLENFNKYLQRKKQRSGRCRKNKRKDYQIYLVE